MMDYTGNVLIVACNKDPEDVAEAILGKSVLSTKVPLDAVNMSYFPWCVDTKYYKVDLGIICARSNDLLKRIPAGYVDRAEACIIYADSGITGLMMIQDIHSRLKNYKRFEINIVVCLHNKAIAIFDTKVNKWCIENYYELIEMKYQKYACKGERFVADSLNSVLYSHHWPNLILKENKSYSCTPSPFLTDYDDYMEPIREEKKKDMERVDDYLKKTTDKEADFDFLSAFSNLSLLKEKMQQLGPKERRDKAKEVVHTFWKAIGGDSDEMESDEDDFK